MTEYIGIRGARENNLKDVSLRIPNRKITMFTGVGPGEVVDRMNLGDATSTDLTNLDMGEPWGALARYRRVLRIASGVCSPRPGEDARFQTTRPGPSRVGVSVAEEGLHGSTGGTNGTNGTNGENAGIAGAP